MDEIKDTPDSIYHKSLTNKEFVKISEFIHEECGIKIPPVKKIMLEGRLRKRLKTLGYKNFDDYFKFLFSQEGLRDELVSLLDVVTTNKTDFFREPDHFEYLKKNILPKYKGRNKIVLWSAPCSSGEEAYTIAIVVDDFLGARKPAFFYSYVVWGSDISTQMLEVAKKAIYNEQRISTIPRHYLHRYFMKSKNPLIKKYRIVPELRRKCDFFRLNFMDKNYFLREKADVVFCRNAIIYFDKPTQEIILNRIVSHMNSGGYLIMGHSETLNGLNVPVRYVAPTIYQK